MSLNSSNWAQHTQFFQEELASFLPHQRSLAVKAGDFVLPKTSVHGTNPRWGKGNLGFQISNLCRKAEIKPPCSISVTVALSL